MILDNFGGFCLKVGIQYESILYFMLRNLAAVCGSTGCNSFCTRVFVMISYITNTSLVLQGYVLIMYALCLPIQYKSKYSECFCTFILRANQRFRSAGGGRAPPEFVGSEKGKVCVSEFSALLRAHHVF